MNDYLYELMADDMGIKGHECPVCLDYIYDPDDHCTCSGWSKEEFEEFFSQHADGTVCDDNCKHCVG